MRAALLSVHLLAVIVWLGAGFYELYLGRLLHRSDGSAAEAVLIRAMHRSGFVVFGATLLAFAAGATMAVVLGWGFFTHLWLGLKQAIALTILLIVVGIFPTALRLGHAIEALPPGDGPVTLAVKQIYGRLEPWYALMRILGVVAVLLAVFRPGTPA
jgi:uncharacterized membrane protein